MRSDAVKERITAAIDRMGRYQILIILLMNLNNLTVGINHTLTSFLTYIPKFFCTTGEVITSTRVVIFDLCGDNALNWVLCSSYRIQSLGHE